MLPAYIIEEILRRELARGRHDLVDLRIDGIDLDLVTPPEIENEDFDKENSIDVTVIDFTI